ncbi:MAG: hypothetical protein KAQ83_02285 [Nanoarchaeota archaeon]|nr:hypothetical protein [Nanoarchaeota archaeon]
MVSKQILKLVKEYCKEFIDKDKPELILLTGSANFISNPEDIDLCVVGKYAKKDIKIYSDFKAITKYSKEFQSNKFEIEYLDWSLIKRDLKRFSFHNWHLRNATIIYDKNNKFKELKMKLCFSKSERKAKMFALFEQAYDYLNDAKSSKRIHHATTKKMLQYKSLSSMIDLVYLINNKFIPSDKWKIYFLKDVDYKPVHLTEKRLSNLKLTDMERLLDSIERVLIKKRLLSKSDFKIIKG